MEEWVEGKVVGNWDQRKDVENDDKHYRMCWKCCDVGRANIELCRYFTRATQGCTLSPCAFNIYTNDMIVAVD